MQILLLFVLFISWFLTIQTNPTRLSLSSSEPRYILLFIGDGMGYNHIVAAEQYTGQKSPYQNYFHGWVSTYPYNGNYSPSEAWRDFDWVRQTFVTDSAAAATAIFSGVKTSNGRINVSPDGSTRYRTITEEARQQGLAVGVVTSVPISHATPGAWIAHNDSRLNGYAIANEGIWGNPNKTGTKDLPNYGGGHGDTLPPIDVIIGGGHPSWYQNQNYYIDQAIYLELLNESNLPNQHRFIERQSGKLDGGTRLLALAQDPNTRKLVGLFGGENGHLEFRLADGSGRDKENPSLSEMTRAALEILGRSPNGFVLLVEGGAIDYAAHQNNLNKLIGEVIDFNEAVQTAIDWVNDAQSPADWTNTLLIVTADHETGYLTRAPNEYPDRPLGEVSARTLQLERSCKTTCLRASWEDENNNGEIDSNETVYWAWNSPNHTNSLVPIYYYGSVSISYISLIDGHDPVRGDYIDNTDIYKLMLAKLKEHKLFIPLLFH